MEEKKGMFLIIKFFIASDFPNYVKRTCTHFNKLVIEYTPLLGSSKGEQRAMAKPLINLT